MFVCFFYLIFPLVFDFEIIINSCVNTIFLRFYRVCSLLLITYKSASFLDT